MTSRVPKTRNHRSMTEAAFWGWIRSTLRKASMRWKPRSEALKAGRRPYTGDDKRTRWEYKCTLCNKWYKAKAVQVDHIEPVGSLTKASDLPRFVEGLFCEVDNLRVLCRVCHQAITNLSRARK